MRGAGGGLRAARGRGGERAGGVGRWARGSLGRRCAASTPPPHPPAARRRAAAGCFPQAYGLRRRRQGAVPAP